MSSIIPTQSTIRVEKIRAAIALNAAELGIRPEFARIHPKFHLHTYTALPSTSTQLWKLLAAGAPSGTVVIAQQQSAGKGQRGRTWESPSGGLYLSLGLEPNWPVKHSAQLTCLSAWGIATALNNLGIDVQIKWPNDLLFRGKKLGGILTETKLSQAPESAPQDSPSKASEESKTKIKQAVIGVGINWHNPTPHTGISLAKVIEEIPSELGKNKINCLEMLIAIVLRGILQGVLFQQQVSSQVFMKSYRKLLTQVGQTVSLDSSGKLSLATPAVHPHPHSWANRSGEVIGISEEGYLQVALHPAFSRDNAPSLTGLSSTDLGPADSVENILLLKPSEIHIS
ncbi:MAG: biotin--[acetyl-CoA-carboxylase] ligase [Cyanobacteria bacterium J06598_1]